MLVDFVKNIEAKLSNFMDRTGKNYRNGMIFAERERERERDAQHNFFPEDLYTTVSLFLYNAAVFFTPKSVCGARCLLFKHERSVYGSPENCMPMR